MPKPFIAFILVFLLLISALFAWNQNKKSLQVQQPIPLVEFSLPDLAGSVYPISHWQGKILVINFWATWCPPCLKEIPLFIELQTEYAQQNVQFIGIAIDDPLLVDDYLSFIDINYPILIAETGGAKLSQKLGNTVNAVPFTVIVNQQSQIIFRHPAELTKQKLRELIEPLLTP
ncbi:redoxin [Methylococcaceae bacterium CS5]|nr:redoxin [Methylococcaceae bacterium CS4]TXK99964.1 redoxin [Methylococcaceae bacterium CS5]TXL07826.1 redoxin [Methylococcaceae bacterium CS3]TXL10937.1 redoxin [Methylococcaceae bacterium CS2]